MLAVVGGKGGCGKTTTSLCLARAIARRESGAIAVDADVDMPDLHTVAGTPSEPDLGAIADGGAIDDSLHRSLVVAGVDVVPAPSDSRVVPSAADRLESRFERVIIDTPAGASRDVTRALGVANRSIVVTTPTRASIADAVKSVELARALGAKPIGTIVTRSSGSIDPEPVIGCRTLCHVPAVKEPLRDHRVTTAYATCVRHVSKRNV